MSIWYCEKRTMRKVMKTAEKLNMTRGDFAFIYIDLYNTNSSYYWTDYDDHLDQSTANQDDTNYNSEHFLNIFIVFTYSNAFVR